MKFDIEVDTQGGFASVTMHTFSDKTQATSITLATASCIFWRVAINSVSLGSTGLSSDIFKSQRIKVVGNRVSSQSKIMAVCCGVLNWNWLFRVSLTGEFAGSTKASKAFIFLSVQFVGGRVVSLLENTGYPN